MKVSPITVAQRRALLLARIANERRMVSDAVEVWRQPLALIDLGRSVGRFVRLHPIAVLCGYAVLRLVLPHTPLRAGNWWRYGRHLALALIRI